MSARDFNWRLLGPVTAFPRRPLSSSASTDSCNMRFSLRTMMSGAFKSSSRRKRLLRLITRRYRSLRSEVANRPPSRGTKGRRSGGRTGRTSMIIHSGLFPEWINASTTLSRLISFLVFVSDVDSASCSRSSADSILGSSAFNNSLIASAPIPASKSAPYSSTAS